MNNFNVMRILDANVNRAREGLRVAEEYARFVLDNAALTERLKLLRHDFVATVQILATAETGYVGLQAFRDTAGDVGTTACTAGEARRDTPLSVAKAALKRSQEALRSLEEYGKIVQPRAAERFEALRYRLYDIEPLIMAEPDRRAALQRARLYVLVTESLASTDALTACREAVAGGADVIQMREKTLEDGPFYEQATRMRAICRESGALLILNDRPHIVALSDADGVHSGQGDLPVHLLRRLVGPDRIIGRSTHGPEDLETAFLQGADYCGVGPVYETQTKAHRAAVGLEYVRHAAAHARLPCFCIGSINRETLTDVLDAGARAVAVCTGIIAAKDIAAETAWFKERLAERDES